MISCFFKNEQREFNLRDASQRRSKYRNTGCINSYSSSSYSYSSNSNDSNSYNHSNSYSRNYS